VTKIKVFYLVVLTFFWAAPATAQLEDFGLSPAQVERAAKGELVVMKFPPPNDAGISFQAVQRMSVDPEKLRPVLRDCQHFSKFMPHTLKSQMRNQVGQTAVCDVIVDMPFPFDDLWSIVNSKWGELKPGVWQRSWVLVEGSFNRNVGSWTIVESGQPNVVYAIYKASVDPKIAVPDFILRRAQVSSIPNLMQAVLKRAQSMTPAVAP